MFWLCGFCLSAELTCVCSPTHKLLSFVVVCLLLPSKLSVHNLGLGPFCVDVACSPVSVCFSLCTPDTFQSLIIFPRGNWNSMLCASVGASVSLSFCVNLQLVSDLYRPGVTPPLPSTAGMGFSTPLNLEYRINGIKKDGWIDEWIIVALKGVHLVSPSKLGCLQHSFGRRHNRCLYL